MSKLYIKVKEVSGGRSSGYDFAAQVRRHWPDIQQMVSKSGSHSGFEAWLIKRIGGKRGDSWIDQLELNVASRACEVLGLRLVEGRNAPLSGHGSSEWTQYADVGYRVLRGGIGTFEAALSEMLMENGVDRRFFSTVYGPLTTWLKGSGLGAEFEPLKAIIRDKIFENFSVRSGVLVLGKPLVGKTGNSKPIAVEALTKPVIALMLQRGLADKTTDGKVVPAGFVTQPMIRALEREASGLCQLAGREARPGKLRNSKQVKRHDLNAMTVVDVAARLKITKPTVIYLHKNNLLESIKKNDFRRDGSIAICRCSVEKFEKTYVSLGVLAAQNECRQGALAIKLKNESIPMLAMPPKYSRIFWQKDIKVCGHLFLVRRQRAI